MSTHQAQEIIQPMSYLGDALQVLTQLPDHFFDACIADPPYNMSGRKELSWAFSNHVTMRAKWDHFDSEQSYLDFSQRWIQEITRIVKPNGNIFIFGSFHNIYSLGGLLKSLDRKFINSIIWSKPNAQPNITCRMLTESTEQIIWCCNASPKQAKNWVFHYDIAKQYNQGKQLRNVWSIPVTPKSERVADHPNQKPLQLMERLILLATNPGDWVIDPFAGVGTVGVVAAANQRNFVLIDNELKYFEAQRLRLSHINPMVFKVFA